jgi:hypothetical protein
MRIAQISPLFEAVPPKLYGGTERVVYSLTEELVALGHDVTLFASGDSKTSATLAPMREQALRLDPTVKDWVATYYRMVELIYRRKDEFDVLHFHIDYFPLSLFSRQHVPYVTTIHGRLDIPEFIETYGTYLDSPFVSISNSQRRPVPQLNWVRTVLHGIPANLLTPQPVRQEYAAFLGRISPEKGVDRAIKIAGKAGLKLKIAAKDQAADPGQSRCRVHRGDQRQPETGLPVRRPCPDLPHRLAGTVRPCDDRGHGLRHPRHRLQFRLGSRSDGPWGHWFHCQRYRPGGRGSGEDPYLGPRPCPRHVRPALHRAPHGGRLCRCL